MPAPILTEQGCANCKFAFAAHQPSGPPVLLCRRYPPLVQMHLLNPLPESVQATGTQPLNYQPRFHPTIIFPRVANSDWCGEWIPMIVAAGERN